MMALLRFIQCVDIFNKATSNTNVSSNHVTNLGYEDDDLVEFQSIQQIVELAVLLGFLELWKNRDIDRGNESGWLRHRNGELFI